MARPSLVVDRSAAILPCAGRARNETQQRCYIVPVPAPDPTRDPTREPARLGQLLALLRDMDEAIGQLYADRGAGRVRQRFVWPMLRLAHEGPMTITQLSRSLGLTHSALSQTVAQMRRAGLVSTVAGPGDGRTRSVALTAQGRELVPLLEAEWRATEAAVRELDDALPVPLSRVAADLADQLRARPFRDRIEDHLAPPRDQGPEVG